MGAITRWRASLNIHRLNDSARENALTGIQKVAQQGALYNDPTVAASYAAFTAKGTTLTTTVASVAANEKVLKASIGARFGEPRDGADVGGSTQAARGPLEALSLRAPEKERAHGVGFRRNPDRGLGGAHRRFP